MLEASHASALVSKPCPRLGKPALQPWHPQPEQKRALALECALSSRQHHVGDDIKPFITTTYAATKLFFAKTAQNSHVKPPTPLQITKPPANKGDFDLKIVAESPGPTVYNRTRYQSRAETENKEWGEGPRCSRARLHKYRVLLCLPVSRFDRYGYGSRKS